MIETDEHRGHIYARVADTKIAEFNAASNSLVDEFENLCDEKDSNSQPMFIYYFKIHQRRIFYTESRRQHLKLYDMENKCLLCQTDFSIWPQYIGLSPCGQYIAVCEDKKCVLGKVETDPDNEEKVVISLQKSKEKINDEMVLFLRFAKFGDNGLRIVTTSPDMSLVVSNLDLEMTHSFNPNDKTEIHEHWVTMAEWHEELGMLISYAHDQTFSMVMFD